MASIDVGSGRGHKRATNSDINMIPFIDLLMVTVAFLLITAVWVSSSRVPVDAQLGGERCERDCHGEERPELHVSVRDAEFALSWKQGKTVISEALVPRSKAADGAASPRYDELAKAVAREWAEHRSHVDPDDRKSDVAVLHSDDKTSFRELVGVLDAIHATKRDYRIGGKLERAPAFATAFAAR